MATCKCTAGHRVAMITPSPGQALSAQCKKGRPTFLEGDCALLGHTHMYLHRLPLESLIMRCTDCLQCTCRGDGVSCTNTRTCVHIHILYFLEKRPPSNRSQPPLEVGGEMRQQVNRGRVLCRY